MPTDSCPTCGAPVVSTIPLGHYGPTDPMWSWRFDAERFLREKIAALTDEQLVELLGSATCLDWDGEWASVSRDPVAFRAALLETLLSGERTQ